MVLRGASPLKEDEEVIMKSLSNERNIKTVIITGGNSGLGYESAKEIASNNKGEWHIVLACRNPEKAASAVSRLIAETGNARIEAMELDLASLASVRQFAKEFAARPLPPLHALVCNAGLQVVSGTTYTKDGFETTFGVNHLGHFLLVNLLLKDLQGPARILFVSSDTHDVTKKSGMPAPVFQNVELLAHPKPDGKNANFGTIGRTRYTTSKLCNIYCTYELSRRLHTEQKDQDITVNAFNPSLMSTGLARDYSLPLRFVSNVILPALGSLGLKFRGVKLNNLDDSSKALARMVTDSQYAGITGKYFDIGKEIPSSDESYDKQNARNLWEQSAEMVGLAAEENPFSRKTPVGSSTLAVA